MPPVGERKDAGELGFIDPETGQNRQPGVLSHDDVNKLFADDGKMREPEPPKEDEPGGRDKLGPVGEEEPPPGEGPDEKELAAKREKGKGEKAAEAGKGDEGEEIEDPEITVGGETKTASEWFTQMEQEDDADYSELPAETQRALLERYLTSKNRDAWQREGQRRDQTLAEDRRDLSRQTRELEHEKRRVQRELAKAKESLAKAQALGAQRIDENELYDEEGRPIRAKEREFNKILDAREAIPDLEQEIQLLQQEAAQADADHLLAQIEGLQASHPELKTRQPIKSVARAIERDKDINHPDFGAYRLIQKVLREADESSVDAETAYQILLAEGVLKPVRAKSTFDFPTDKGGNPHKNLIENIRRKQERGSSRLPPGVTSREQRKGKVRLGTQIRDELSRQSGAGQGDLLTRLGF